MSVLPKTTRMRAPFMSVFRSAHADRDAKRQLDLRDEDGDRIVAGRRGGGQSAISELALQRAVGGDVENLLNAVNLAATIDLSEFPDVCQSILNFGIPDIAHRSLEDGGVNDISEELETALKHFEPRLVGETIEVERDRSLDDIELRVRFVVTADMACKPLNIPVQFIAELERESGQVTIGRD